MKIKAIDPDGTSSLPAQIKRDIYKKIDSAALKPGDRILSETRLADSYGVSRMTARQALIELINEGKLTRIPGRGTFVSEKIPPPPEQGKKPSARVMVISPGLRNSFYYQIIAGLEKVLTLSGPDVLLRSVNEDPLEEKRCLERALELKAAVALIAGEYSAENLDLIKNINAELPFVNIDVALQHLESDLVVSDDRRGGFIAAKHLLELGHKNIVHLAGPYGDSSADERVEGYREALLKSGIEPGEEFVRRAGWHYEEGYYETKKFLRNSSGLSATAVFACSDEVGAGAYRALIETGLNVPDDAAIVGYANLDCGKFLVVPLTTVDQSAPEMGRTAGLFLLDKITGKRPLSYAKRARIGVKLVIRDSCGIKGRGSVHATTQNGGRRR